MAWWDHEELKDPKYRSNRYKIAFPEEYSASEVRKALEEETKSKIKQDVAKLMQDARNLAKEIIDSKEPFRVKVRRKTCPHCGKKL